MRGKQGGIDLFDDVSPEDKPGPDTPEQWSVPGLPRALTISVLGMAFTALAAVLLTGHAKAASAGQLVTLARTTPTPSLSPAAPAFVSNGLVAAAAATGSQVGDPAPPATTPLTAVAGRTGAPVPVPVPTSIAAATPSGADLSPIAKAAAATLRTQKVALPLPPRYLRGGSVDQGVDYTAPGGTPLYAMGPGIIISEGGIAGFGPNTPVLLITAGPLQGRTIYYGHAGPDTVPVGTHVAAGQQIGVVGSGIVGMSTGPHLEVGFYPLTGNTGAGAAMMAYINAMVGHPT